MTLKRAAAQYIQKDLSVAGLGDPIWHSGEAAIITSYWNGHNAPQERWCEARLLWSERFLYVRFDASQKEPLITKSNPDTTSKTLGLWERDVCEIFIAPDTDHRHRYFEFEVAPTGEWLDLAITVEGGKRETDWEYQSGLKAAAGIGDDTVTMALTIPWSAFGATPSAGDIWAGNLFRCVGSGDDRGYLAWQPTMTEVPNFHVPRRFGDFVFDQ